MSAWRAVTVVLTLMGLAAMQLWRLSTAAGFPPDIANRQYEFLHEGDVNLGAVVSVHKSVRGRCIEATTTGKSVSVSVHNSVRERCIEATTTGKSVSVSVSVHNSVRGRCIEALTTGKSVSVSVSVHNGVRGRCIEATTTGKSVSVSKSASVSVTTVVIVSVHTSAVW